MELGTARREASTGSTTMADLASLAASKHSAGIALRHKVGDDWVDVTFEELGEVVSEIGRGLIGLGIGQGDRVSILCNTRPEWTYSNLAILAAGAASVSIYQTNSPEECHYVLHHSESRAVFVEDQEQLAKIREVEDDLPNLEFKRAMRSRSTSYVSAAAATTAPSSRSGAPGSLRRTRASSSTRPAPPGRPRA